MNKKELAEKREATGVRPLQDVVLDTIIHAIKRSGSIHQAAFLLDISEPTIRKRLRKGYSDGRKAKL